VLHGPQADTTLQRDGSGNYQGSTVLSRAGAMPDNDGIGLDRGSDIGFTVSPREDGGWRVDYLLPARERGGERSETFSFPVETRGPVSIDQNGYLSIDGQHYTPARLQQLIQERGYKLPSDVVND
jgi:hypothetical protein